MVTLSIRMMTMVIVALALNACAIKITPSYDLALIEKIEETNEMTLILFSGISSGSDKLEYSNIEKEYNNIIGRFDAIRTSAESRTLPSLGKAVVARAARSGVLPPNCSEGDGTACLNTTPAAAQNIIDVIGKMKLLHEKIGIASDLVEGFKLQYEANIDQVLQIEKALVQ